MIRKGELTEFKPDKMTLGVAPVKEASFTNNCIETKPGDSFYMFSDGFSISLERLQIRNLSTNISNV